MLTVIINGSPRKHGNTASLCNAFADGVRAAQPAADIRLVHLSALDFKGCTSCFACKLRDGASYGRCAVRDALTPILETVSQADCLVVASPIYLGEVTGATQSFLERLCFAFGSYEAGYRPLSPKKMPVVTLYTMNSPAEAAPVQAFERVERFLGHIFTPPRRLCSYDTYQFADYARYVAELFSEPAKRIRRERHFPHELEAAYRLGAELASAAG